MKQSKRILTAFLCSLTVSALGGEKTPDTLKVYNLADEDIRAGIYFDGGDLTANFITIKPSAVEEIPIPKSKILAPRAVFVTTDPKLNEKNFKSTMRQSLKGLNSGMNFIGKFGNMWSKPNAPNVPVFGEVFAYRGTKDIGRGSISKNDTQLNVSTRQAVPWYHRDDLLKKINTIAPDIKIKV